MRFLELTLSELPFVRALGSRYVGIIPKLADAVRDDAPHENSDRTNGDQFWVVLVLFVMLVNFKELAFA